MKMLLRIWHLIEDFEQYLLDYMKKRDEKNE